MKRNYIRTIVTLSLLCGASSTAQAATYYVNSAGGSDTNLGTSPNTAWRTLTHVNTKTFIGGDTILFKVGCAWLGQLRPQGTGSAGNPIRIDSYSHGPSCGHGVTSGRPLINGGGPTFMASGTQGAVYLRNQPYWEIRNLEVTNCIAPANQPCPSLSDVNAPRAQLVGIQVVNNSGAQINHIYIGGNKVHQVSGNIADFTSTAFWSKNGGIVVASDMYNGSRYSGVTIQANDVSEVDRVGIFVGPLTQQDGMDPIFARSGTIPTTGVLIKENIVKRSGGDGIFHWVVNGIVVDGNIVEASGQRGNCSAAIFSTASRNTTWQYNEVYDTAPGCDRVAFDVDWGSVSNTIQYNYSHNNYGGFVMNWETHRWYNGGACDSENTYIDNEIVRFNVSVNDGNPAAAVFNFMGEGRTFGQPCTAGVDEHQFPFGSNPPDIANNTIWLDGSEATPVIRQGGYPVPGNSLRVVARYSGAPPPADNCGGYPCGLYFYNNIIYSGRWQSGDLLSWTPNMYGAVIDFNTYYGTFSGLPNNCWPPCGNDKYRNPMLVSPSTAVNAKYPPVGRANTGGFKLSIGSSEIGTGFQSGFLGPVDFWGNPVSSTAAPNRGAYNGAGVP